MKFKQIIKHICIAFVLFIMALYPTYKNITQGSGLYQYENHKLFMENNSHSFDPWQYRILCPLLVEKMFYILDATVLNTLYNTFKNKSIHTNTPQLQALQQDSLFFKYTIVFIVCRFLEDLCIYLLLWHYLFLFTKNKLLISIFILLAVWAMGNAVMNSDLSLNTYMDIIFYLTAAYIIVSKKNIYWILPLSILGAMNRETAAFIPLMLFFAHCDIKNKTLPPKKIWFITSVSVFLFFFILIIIRIHFGYRPDTHPWHLLVYNLFTPTNFHTYFEMFGALGVFPFMCFYYFRKNSYLLQMFFFLIVPIWFSVHLIGTYAREARCFLMPLFVIFMPMIIEIIEEKYKSAAN